MTVKLAGRAPEILGVYAVFLAVTTVAIALRVYSRTRLVRNFALDDWLALISWAFFVCLCAFAITGCYHGNGQHAWDIKPASEIPVGLKWWWLCEPVYVLSNMAIKGSIAVMLLRLTIVPTHRIIIWITIVITELYSASFFFLFLFQCSPSSYFWTQWTGGKGSCINPQITVHLTYAYSAITCVGDWIFAILPFFMVWKLQMERRQKFLVALILAMGAIASTATIIRIPYLASLSNHRDFLYATTDVAIWSCCENGLGIIAASCATLRPLFREWKFLGASQAIRGGRYTGAYRGASAPNSFALRRGPSDGYARRAQRDDSWPSGAGMGYSRGHVRGQSSDAAVNIGHENMAGLGPTEIKKTTHVSVEDYGYAHELADTEWAGSDSSERGICGASLKALPPVPHGRNQEV